MFILMLLIDCFGEAMNKVVPVCVSAAIMLSINLEAADSTVGDEVIESQRTELSENTAGMGFGPQSPRNIDYRGGVNEVVFSDAPEYSKMHLCNIHFHENAEHAGGEFDVFAGNGDGNGYGTGYVYSGELSQKEKNPASHAVCEGAHGDLRPGDTIELHYVHSTAQVGPGPTLGACLSESIMNPQLRVEAQVFVLVSDKKALDFSELTALGMVNGYSQALNIPSNTGEPVVYSGSTTGPSYNTAGSPLQVTWSVRPEVAKVDISTVGEWCEGNVFDEDHAHGVRNLITNPDLLSPIE